MKILLGCEKTQEVCKAFRERGHEAYSCDIKPCSGGHPEWHLQMDVFKAIGLRAWDMAIFFPDCTYLTCSAEWAYKEGPYHQKVKPRTLVGKERIKARGEAFEFFMALWNCGIPKISMENPVGIMSRYFRKPDQIIHPYEFGNDASKATCLWLKNLPILKKNNDYFILPRTICSKCSTVQMLPGHVKISLRDGCIKCGSKVRPRWGNQTDSGQNKLSPSDIRAEIRSKTYPGIAQAMAEQWG